MRALLLRVVTISLGYVLWAQPAVAQPYVYTVSNAYSFSSDGPATSPVLQVRSGTSLASLGSLTLAPSGSAADIVLGPADRRLYVAVSVSSSSGASGVYIVDTLTNTLAKTITSVGTPSALAMSPDRSRLYVGSTNRVSVVRTSDDTVVAQFVVSGAPTALAVSPDDATLYAAMGDRRAVAFINLATQGETGSVAFAQAPLSLAVAADGTRLYVGAGNSFSAPSGNEIDAVDVTTRQIVGTAQAGGAPNALMLMADGATLYASTSVVTGGFGNFQQLEVYDTATLSRLRAIAACAGDDIAAYAPTSRAYTVGTCGVHSVGTLDVFDTATASFVTSTTISVQSSARIAVGVPAGCSNEVAPRVASFGPGGGTGTLTMTAEPGCSWTISSSAPWVQFTSPSGALSSSASGSGSGTIAFTVAPSTGEPRSATLTSGFQRAVVRQTQPLVWIDEPPAGTAANQPFIVRGWAIDRDDDPADSTFGSGVDTVHVWAYPATGGAPIFLGKDYNGARQDVAAAFGASKYAYAGFTVQARGLAAGAYTIVAFAHSSRTGAFFPATTTITVRADTNPAGAIDAPRAEESLTQPFAFAGWAADLAAAAGTGVDAVHVWAYADGGGSPVFVGAAQYGTWARPDVGGALGNAALTQSGFLLLVDGLKPGGYTFVAFAHSTVTGAFHPRTVHVNVGGEAQPVIHVDAVQTGAGGAFPNGYVIMFGWAVDTRATTGAGVAAIHAWAYPQGGAAPVFLGAATPSRERDITALLFGSQFTNAGWALSAPLNAGNYRVVLYALSAVTGTFDNVRVVDVTVR
jgi:DNA-binding beta-propeller fold protein YncE